MRLQEPERIMGLQAPEGAKAKRKILKPLLERRRRERMNQSLSRLRSLLLPAQGAAERRVEKAEILEHTVLYLRGQSSHGPEQLPLPFQDGFSACLHRATHFLEAGGKAPWLAPTMDAALSTLALESERLGRCPKALLRELTRKRAQSGIAAKTGSFQAEKAAARPRAESAHSGQNKRPSEGPHSGAQSPGLQSYGPQSLWRPWP